MTVVNRNILPVVPNAAPATSPAMFIAVRWTCTITKWIDRFGLFTNGQRHGKVEFIITLTCNTADNSDCTITAWLALHDHRKIVLAAERAQCAVLHDGSLMHVDVTVRGSSTRLLALSFDSDQLVFAQSPLLHQAGFTGGSYDPPAHSGPYSNSRE